MVRYDPGPDTVSLVSLPASTNDVHGLTLDAQNNVYTIHRNSHDLGKITPGGAVTLFGGGILVSPYGYSGDMTGIQSQCVASTTATWLSTPVDSGAPATQWQTITWTATTPAGSGVAIYVRVDGGPWTQVTNGQALGLTGQVLEVKAILSSTIAGNEPTLHDVTVVYAP